MAVELSHTLYPDHLEITLQGTRTTGQELEEGAELGLRIIRLSEKHDQKNILVHMRIRGRLPMNAQVGISFRIEDYGYTPDHRIAAVAYNKEIYDNVQLMMKYWQEEGYRFRLFKNKDNAQRWLLRKHRKSVFLSLFDSFK